MVMMMMVGMTMTKIPLILLQVPPQEGPVCPQKGWEGANWERWAGGDGLLPRSCPQLPGWGHDATLGCWGVTVLSPPAAGPGWALVSLPAPVLRPRPGFPVPAAFPWAGPQFPESATSSLSGRQGRKHGRSPRPCPCPPPAEPSPAPGSGARQGWGGGLGHPPSHLDPQNSQYSPSIIPNVAPTSPSCPFRGLDVPWPLCPLPSVPHQCHPLGHSRSSGTSRSRPLHSWPGAS